MPYKIEGTTNTNGELIVIREDDWSVEKTDTITSEQSFIANALVPGTKTVFGKRPNGEIVGYGNVSAAYGELYGRSIGNALMFNDDDSADLTRSVSSTGSTQQGIFSAWLKRTDVGLRGVFSGFINSSNYTTIRFSHVDTLQIFTYTASAWKLDWSATPLYRDYTGWFHLCVQFDYSNSTPADRLKVYINGEQVSGTFSSTPAITDILHINNSSATQYIGQSGGGSQWHDGYMAEVIWLDGQTSSDPQSLFGEFANGVWLPKTNLDLTYGTNGFLLDFADSAQLGKDVSGQSNNFTGNNLASTDQVSDTTTNNFATLNSAYKMSPGYTPVFAEGNLKGSSTDNNSFLSTLSVSSGKWYAEIEVTDVGDKFYVGIQEFTDMTSIVGQGSYGIAYYDNGQKVVAGSASAYGATYTDGDIIGIELNLDDEEITFYKNGASQGTITMVSGGSLYMMGHSTANPGTYVGKWNFGNPSFTVTTGNADENGYGDFEYAPSTGFLALCTANLPDPAVEDSSEGVYVGTRTGVGKAVTGFGTAQHKTDQYKFGTSSCWLDGNSDRIQLGSMDAIGSSDFCMEGWFRFHTFPGSGYVQLFNKWYTPTNQREYQWRYNHAGQYFRFNWSVDGTNTAYRDSSTVQLTLNTWHHLAMVNDNGDLRFYVDGVQYGTNTLTTSIYNSSAAFNIGSSNLGGGEFVGAHLDDIRFSLGVPRYPDGATFTPPTRFNSRDSYTKLLIQSLNAPNGATQFGDMDYISDVNFNLSSGALLFTKNRDSATNWDVMDTERGAHNLLHFNSTNAEAVASDRFTSFLSNGYSVGSDTNIGRVGYNYLDVAVRKGPAYGLDIVKYTGTGAVHTESHSLNAVPTMIWYKNLETVSNWIVYHSLCAPDPETDIGYLDLTNAFNDDSTYFNDTAPTSTVFTVGINTNINQINVEHIAYLFTDIPGYCKAFAYIGNGNADGPFIPLGFRPKIWFVKCVDTAYGWTTYDTIRNPYNPTNSLLYLDSSGAEGTGYDMDAIGQGIKIRASNAYINTSNILYIGFAWAEAPGKWSNAR